MVPAVLLVRLVFAVAVPPGSAGPLVSAAPPKPPSAYVVAERLATLLIVSRRLEEAFPAAVGNEVTLFPPLPPLAVWVRVSDPLVAPEIALVRDSLAADPIWSP